MHETILVVDDEPQITRVLRTTLESSGYRVVVARNGLEALEKLRSDPASLIITDLSMPEMDGVELTREVRQRMQTPIIILSVQNQDAAKVRALDEGADDYVTKPFSMQELLARVRALLRRSADDDDVAEPMLRAGEFVIDRDAHRVTRGEEDIHLTPKEFDLFLYFARTPGRVHTHKALLRAVWGPAGDDQPEYLRVLVAQLRRKIEPASEPRYIRNEPWVGYRFTPNGEAG
jgi:two-component system KDP operon response regulator KdpE